MLVGEGVDVVNERLPAPLVSARCVSGGPSEPQQPVEIVVMVIDTAESVYRAGEKSGHDLALDVLGARPDPRAEMTVPQSIPTTTCLVHHCPVVPHQQDATIPAQHPPPLSSG
ncbi:MAG: hypothetical protein M3443_13530 [Actinomycetota bacterium]|nr:hypothetical protein [Actinomycetota bacterium]